jgi:hypothetical protein
MNRGTFSRAFAFSLLTVGTAVWGAEQPAAPAPTTTGITTTGITTTAPATPAPAVTNVSGPKIQFETMVYDFGRAKSGDPVKYTYVFTNAGDQLLELTDVHACGCITADWTRKVEPGKTGTVPISFNSSGYSGPVTKAISVTCNDKTTPRPALQFKGTIWKPIDVIPQFAVLNLTADAPVGSATVLITNNMPEPITVSAPQCSNPAFAIDFTTNEPGRAFRVIVTTVPPLPAGSVQAQITLKTTSTNMPVVTITAFANVQPTVTINPPQIVLPPAPLAQALTNTINITDNSTNTMALSEPTVNAAGVNIQVREVVPGRQFAVALTFLQGFEVAVGQKAELSIKSSLPLVPVLKVPIMQAPRPAPPKVVPIKVSSSTHTNRHRPLPPIDLPPLPE